MPGVLQQRGSDLLLRGVGALGGCSIRELQGEEHVALILRGKKASGKTFAEKDRQDCDDCKADHGEGRFVNQYLRRVDEAICGSAEEFVEGGKGFRRADLCWLACLLA